MSEVYLRECFVFTALLLVYFIGQASGANYIEECNLAYHKNRLPEHVRPAYYALHLDLTNEKTNFYGEVNITVNFANRRQGFLKSYKHDYSDLIVLHADEHINIDKVSFTKYGSDGEKPVEIVSICRDFNYGLVEMKLAGHIKPGSIGELRLEFRGKFRSDFEGLYPSVYKDGKHHPINFQATDLEAAYARSLFPCFDEPSFKAIFSLSVTHQADKKVLSNSELESTEVGFSDFGRASSNLRVSRFKATPVMSTYLLAVVVGEFDTIEARSLDGKSIIRVHTPVGRSEDGSTALETCQVALSSMEEYFGIEYPLEKLDLISVPEFKSGAMENWGLILFNEQYLLTGEKASIDAEIEVKETIMHELVHQWMGNLVTMRWWNDLWLNEGFASYLPVMFADYLYPEMEAERHFASRDLLRAFSIDTISDNTKPDPIRKEQVESPEEMEAIFDQMTYLKGPVIVRWLRHWVTPLGFQKAIRIYLGRNQYNNTNLSDLGDVFEEISGLPVKKFLNSYLSQAGHPFVKVSLDFRKNELILTQTDGIGESKKWYIPSEVLVSDGKGRTEILKFILETESTKLALPSWFKAGAPGYFVKLNPGFIGFYRGLYSGYLTKLLEGPIKNRALSSLDRLDIIASRIASYDMEYIGDDQLRMVLEYFSEEDDPVVVSSIYKIAVGQSYERDALMIAKRYCKKSGGLRNNASGSYLELVSKGKLLHLLIIRGDRETVLEGLNLFDSSLGSIPIIYRHPVYLAVALNGSDEQHNRLVEYSVKTESIFERDAAFGSLTYGHDIKRLENLKRVAERDDFVLTGKQDMLRSLDDQMARLASPK